MPRGKQFYFNPWGDRHQDNNLHDGRAKYLVKPNCIVINSPDTLRYISSDSTLLIDGHGDKSGGKLSSVHFSFKLMVDGVPILKEFWQHIPVADLAKLLADNNLPKSQERIRLLACNGAALARALASALRGYHYENIAVAGYDCSVFVVPGSRAFLNLDSGVVQNTSSSGWVRWYNTKGVEIAKPAKVESDEYDPWFPSHY